MAWNRSPAMVGLSERFHQPRQNARKAPTTRTVPSREALLCDIGIPYNRSDAFDNNHRRSGAPGTRLDEAPLLAAACARDGALCGALPLRFRLGADVRRARVHR